MCPTVNSYKQWTNEHTFAREQILRKPIKETCEKNVQNIVFTWLKHNRKLVGPYENTS